ncbi:ImmA/IrrE family metallo-endopeptidase [Qipengyuania gaetbuli]|uniref:ImmA/IrrE family metallo-endopeptidase n=1 Tax=Qipengyuania gaetbuli TaxID=266952 RepID=UPI001CFD5DE8|nr:ImmA/IrrE family metallo-endopeptidase [Qipengyuania gaetbuli]
MIIPSKFIPIIDKYTAEAPVNLGGLASELGLEVYQSTLEPKISGLIEPSNTAPSGFLIKLNRHDPIVRQRFTLAHEIAHFLLHRFDIGRGVVDDTLYRSNLSDRKEVEANKLAARLIMPMRKIREEMSQLEHLTEDQIVEHLAKKFKVSQEAMRIKIGL